jgi:hypothetical protein
MYAPRMTVKTPKAAKLNSIQALLLRLNAFSQREWIPSGYVVLTSESTLKAETIQTLMLVKARLRMARTAVIEILGDDKSIHWYMV